MWPNADVLSNCVPGSRGKSFAPPGRSLGFFLSTGSLHSPVASIQRPIGARTQCSGCTIFVSRETGACRRLSRCLLTPQIIADHIRIQRDIGIELRCVFQLVEGVQAHLPEYARSAGNQTHGL